MNHVRVVECARRKQLKTSRRHLYCRSIRRHGALLARTSADTTGGKYYSIAIEKGKAETNEFQNGMRETSSGCKFCRACARARLPDAGNNLATWNGHGICFIWKGDRIDRTPPGSGSFRGEFASGARSPETCRAWQTGRHRHRVTPRAYVRARVCYMPSPGSPRLLPSTPGI